MNPEKYDVSFLGILRSGECIDGFDSLQKVLDASGGYTGPDDRTYFEEPVNIAKNIVYHVELMNTRPDVIFCLIHGAHGEDGRLQGMFDLL